MRRLGGWRVADNIRRSNPAALLAIAGRLLTLALLIGGAQGALAAEPALAWLTGGPLQARLRLPVDVNWSTAPFRQSLYGLARSKQVAMLLDRRVDPDQRVTLVIRDRPLGEALQQIAVQQGVGQSLLGSVVYFGPTAAGARLRTVAELRRGELRQLGPQAAARWNRVQPLRWDDLTPPRAILARLAEENHLRCEDLSRVPHDLWAAADLPPLPLVERLTLVLIQFDLTFAVDAAGSTLRLTALPENVALERAYPAGRNVEETLRKWAALAPQAKVWRAGDRLLVVGLVEDHERIAAADRPAAERTARGNAAKTPEKRFTLRQAKGQLGELIIKLAGLLQLEVKMDRDALQKAGVNLDQPISLSVSDATIDELFEKLLAPAGCVFRREGNVIEIKARRKDGG